MSESGQSIWCPSCGKRLTLPLTRAPMEWTICPACGSRVPLTIAGQSAAAPIAAPPIAPAPIPPPPTFAQSTPPVPPSAAANLPSDQESAQFIVPAAPVRPPAIVPGMPVLPGAAPIYRIPTAPPPYVATTQPATYVSPNAGVPYPASQQPARLKVALSQTAPSPAETLNAGALREIQASAKAARDLLDEQTPDPDRPIKWGIIVAISAVSVAAMAALILLLIRSTAGPQLTWERQHSAEIRQDIAAAEDAFARHDPELAIDRYNDVESLIGNNPISDPQLAEAVRTARKHHDDLLDQLVASKTPATKPAAVVNVAPPSPEAAAPSTEPIAEIPLVATAAAPQHHLPAHPAPASAIQLTDAQIGDAIEKAVNYLLSQINSGLDGDPGEYRDGEQVLITYALLQAGQSVQDDRLDIQGPLMSRLISQMRSMDLEGRLATYTRSLRATALSLLNRPEDRATLQADVDFLVASSIDGAFTYGRPAEMPGTGINSPPREFRSGPMTPDPSLDGIWDNSNSQYGLLGVWSGAEVGCTVPPRFWEAVADHWTRTQIPGGQWGYNRIGSEPRLSMTLAGVASLLVANDYLGAIQHGNEVGRSPYDPPLQAGLDFLAHANNCIPTISEFSPGYTLYGVERVGLASGYKFFGSHDWYSELASMIIKQQYRTGSWGNTIESAYELLFLARGRHPILMNKLLFDGEWDNRPRDVANLAKFASRELELPLNWQIVPIDQSYVPGNHRYDGRDWTDSPILYLASHKAPSLSSEQIANIRGFIRAGGMLFTQADAGSPEFDKFANALGKQLYPEYAWQDLPPDHPLYNSFYPLKPSTVVKPRIISNGARILMLHLPQDISRYWQLRQDHEQLWAHQFGVNMYVYAAGKSDLQNRLSTNAVTRWGPKQDDVNTFGLALIVNGLDSDPEPGAWDRFANWFQNQTSLGLEPVRTAISTLDPKQTPLAHFTGTAAYTLSADDLAHLASYVDSGGILLVDPCGQGDAFTDSAHDMLAKAFPSATLAPMPLSHPALSKSTDNGMFDIASPQLRPFARQKFSREDARPQMFTSGRGCVIYLPLDMTSGLLNTNTWGIAGYDPDYAQRLASNLILWTWAGAPQTEMTR